MTCTAITAQSNHGEAKNTVHLATMQRAKGLEFDAVLVLVPRAYVGEPERTQQQRKLLDVARTRAKAVARLITLP